jgi:hypothetical protein
LISYPISPAGRRRVALCLCSDASFPGSSVSLRRRREVGSQEGSWKSPTVRHARTRFDWTDQVRCGRRCRAPPPRSHTVQPAGAHVSGSHQVVAGCHDTVGWVSGHLMFSVSLWRSLMFFQHPGMHAYTHTSGGPTRRRWDEEAACFAWTRARGGICFVACVWTRGPWKMNVNPRHTTCQRLVDARSTHSC